MDGSINNANNHPGKYDPASIHTVNTKNVTVCICTEKTRHSE